LEPKCHGKIFNLNGPVASLRELAEVLVELTGGKSKIEIVEFPAEKKRIDIGDYYGSADAMKAASGWHWKTDLKQGLSATVKFYEKNLSKYLPGEEK
jgi:UDP-glucose 4-epimerase